MSLDIKISFNLMKIGCVVYVAYIVDVCAVDVKAIHVISFPEDILCVAENQRH